MLFTDLNLNKPLLQALNDLGYTKPTTIQEKSFSVMMSGRDVVGIAQTGTGKTIAYLLPCLRQWTFSAQKVPTILIIVPTRELVQQVVATIEQLTKYMNINVAGIIGGVNIKNQIETINKGLDIIVATPGRLLELSMNGTLRLNTIKKLVIDEVDELLNLGFRHQLINILSALSPKRQNLLFSATLSDEVEQLFTSYFNSPEKIEAAPVGTPLENITQTAFHVPNFYTKINLLELLLNKDPEMQKVLVFTATKSLADQVYGELEKEFAGKVGVIHSNKDQNNRFNTVKQFKEGNYRLLVATDVIARGIDIAEVSHVINFDLPEAPENYIHRIGRTGRADRKGKTIAFITSNEKEQQKAIEKLMRFKIPVEELPAELIISEVLTEDELPKFKMKEIKLKRPKREDVGPSFHEKKDKNKKVNQKITRAEQMRIKYGKPKTRGDKNQNKKK